MVGAIGGQNTFLYELNVKKGRLDKLINHIDTQSVVINPTSNVTNLSGSSLDESKLRDDARGLLPLSGYTPSMKISIWGKLNGLDNSMSSIKQRQLREFIDSTQILGRSGDFALSEQIKAKPLSVDEYIRAHKNHEGIANIDDSELYNMLDMYSDIDEFKKRWLEFSTRRKNDLAASKELAEYVLPRSSTDVGLSGDDPQLVRRLMMTLNDTKGKILTYELEKDPNFAFLKDKIEQIDEKIGLESIGNTEKLNKRRKELEQELQKIRKGIDVVV